MIKKVTKIGNSQGIIFDTALMDLANLKVGDELNVTIHDGGTITLAPVRAERSPEEVSKVIKEVMTDYAATMKKLA